ncbi:transcription elongation factor GreA [Candidatus Falkowbacteria bacterium CG10_big_fil_rev_8_21_14_0_10_37_14]|uniref:Transcription elongation factor GreA n=1 Tax=Candidatus Falkowbacteria bacterium CG10_big_fil_rev_8_21_14_0_10_37_14 TaxID=1974561 RepID=A0A2M6WSL4_9BACT|nr:transcription elongation factor GreA [Candidatus Falkowbacteria bacterium]PIT95761.1 MAG: transcription elongation factor GreA [Candidatus Falkowbacteria bacterium CG10_big_fil_rev_8_21_14_0_10_37_14]
MNSQIISPEGYQKLKDELEQLSTVKRREIAVRIESAKELGDLSENAEYADAKEAQAFNDGRIMELSNLLKNLTVVEGGNTGGVIGMGSEVVVETDGVKKNITIVSFNESDPMAGKISNESPLGIALQNHIAGDQVVFATPKGEATYKIISVS